MHEMIRRLDEKKAATNPYLQPFEPNAFFQWMESNLSQQPSVNSNMNITPHDEISHTVKEEEWLAPSEPESFLPSLQPQMMHAPEMSPALEMGMFPMNESMHNPSLQPIGSTPEMNFTNHPLFPPFPMNEEQWQQYTQNPRPPLNPYPTNPYPSTAKATKQTKSAPTGPMANFLSHFKSVDGNYDFPKMMNTAGSMLNSVNQVSSIVKSVGGLFIGGLK